MPPPPVDCPRCGKSFATVSSRNLHIKLIHEKLLRFPCPVDGCVYRAPSAHNLKEHQSSHTTRRPFACDKCDKTYKTMYYLHKHKRDRHIDGVASRAKHRRPGEDGTASFKCDQCDRRYMSKGAVVLHAKNIHNTSGGKKLKNRREAPTTPPREFLTAHDLLTNYEGTSDEEDSEDGYEAEAGHSAQFIINTSPTTSTDKSIVCADCGYKARKPCDLKLHIRRKHTDDKPYHCDECMRAFADRRSLNHHKEFMHSATPVERNFVCQLCGKSYKRMQALSQHRSLKHKEFATSLAAIRKADTLVRKATVALSVKTARKARNVNSVSKPGNPKFQCPQCSLRLSSQGTLTRHMKTHTGDRPFKCCECSADYTALSALRAHLERTGHVNKDLPEVKHKVVLDEPIVCGNKGCGKQFNSEESYQTHRIYHHSVHQCGQCDKKYTYRHHLNAHIQLKHEDSSKFACDQCSHKAFNATNLARHKQIHDKLNRLPCDYCERTFVDELYLNSHISFDHELQTCTICGLMVTLAKMEKHNDEHQHADDDKELEDSGDGDGVCGSVNSLTNITKVIKS